MRLVDVENKLKKLIEEEGPQSDNVYNMIFELVAYYLRHRKAIQNADDLEEVARIGAADLYMRIYKGNTIVSWLGYISRAYHGYIRIWRSMQGSELIDATENLDMQDAIANMCTGSSKSASRDFQIVNNHSYIDNIVDLIDDVVDSSRYTRYTSEFLNAKLSIVLSFYRSDFISYGIRESEIPYVRMLYNISKEYISRNIRDTIDREPGTGLFNDLRLYSMGEADIDSN